MDKEDVIHTYTHNAKVLTHKKYSKVVPFAATYMQLEIITLSEVNQKNKEKYHMISLIREV